MAALSSGTTLGIVGAGAMGGALLRGVLASGVPQSDVWAVDKSEKTAHALAAELGIRTGTSCEGLAATAGVVILGVKPVQVDQALRDLVAAGLRPSAIVISVAAGVTIARLEEHLAGPNPVIRAMPNTPALVGLGMTAIAAGTHAGAADLAIAQHLFTAVGKCVTVEERQINAVTAISGSGPAYIYTIIEALADAGVSVGLPRDTAMTLVTQTVLGAATMVEQSGRHPAALRNDVTTPAGCTIAALLVMEDGKIRSVLARAVEAARQVLVEAEAASK